MEGQIGAAGDTLKPVVSDAAGGVERACPLPLAGPWSFE
jgi:hypothetical protein